LPPDHRRCFLISEHFRALQVHADRFGGFWGGLCPPPRPPSRRAATDPMVLVCSPMSIKRLGEVGEPMGGDGGQCFQLEDRQNHQSASVSPTPPGDKFHPFFDSGAWFRSCGVSYVAYGINYCVGDPLGRPEPRGAVRGCRYRRVSEMP
jgi:hypothetical protein